MVVVELREGFLDLDHVYLTARDNKPHKVIVVSASTLHRAVETVSKEGGAINDATNCTCA